MIAKFLIDRMYKNYTECDRVEGKNANYEDTIVVTIHNPHYLWESKKVIQKLSENYR